MRFALGAAASLAFAGCYVVDPPPRPDLSSFEVRVAGVYLQRSGPGSAPVEFGTPGTAPPVVTACERAIAEGATRTPGTQDCPFAMSSGTVGIDVDVEITAIARRGGPLTAFSGPVSFGVVPGDLSDEPAYRWMEIRDGVGRGVVRIGHVYGAVRVWAKDAPPEPFFADGGMLTDALPPEPEARTGATGVTAPIWFEDPTLARVQMPDDFDNRGSPLEGQFLTVGRTPESGSVLTQSCEDDPENDGRQVMLVVTGLDPSGFFVTDVTACRQPERLVDHAGQTQVRVPEPTGFLPGTFGSIFVYNYSFPEGLDQGDLLWTLAGSIQEFTSTTQMTFPSWTVAESVRLLPESQWNKHLALAVPKEIGLRTCGLDDVADPFLTDTLCGHNRRNLKLESLESGLVRVRNVRFADEFRRCDRDGDGQVPFFCETIVGQSWEWVDCTTFSGASTLTPAQQEELACHIDCVAETAGGPLCTEATTFEGFGQYLMELAGPGPAAAGLDETLPARFETLALSDASTRAARTFAAGAEVRVYCDAPARLRFGDASVVAGAEDELVEPGALRSHVLASGESRVALVADATSAPGGRCWVAENPRARIFLVTRDAVPELSPDCDPNDADADRAEQCRFLRGARFDVVGHLRQVQPARPRWAVLPRDQDDLCCRPGPGLECPRPVERCE